MMFGIFKTWLDRARKSSAPPSVDIFPADDYPRKDLEIKPWPSKHMASPEYLAAYNRLQIARRRKKSTKAALAELERITKELDQ